jgi:hypothetical protein
MERPRVTQTDTKVLVARLRKIEHDALLGEVGNYYLHEKADVTFSEVATAAKDAADALEATIPSENRRAEAEKVREACAQIAQDEAAANRSDSAKAIEKDIRALDLAALLAFPSAGEQGKPNEDAEVKRLRNALQQAVWDLNAEANHHREAMAGIEAIDPDDTSESDGHEHDLHEASLDALVKAIVAIQNAVHPPTPEIAF